MRQVRLGLRLHHGGAATRDIGRSLGVARSTVQDMLKRASEAKLPWPLPDGLSDEALEAMLFARPGGSLAGARRRPEPDWGHLTRELKRPGVTMMILWDEYRETWPEGYGYSRFCDLLRGFQQRLSPVMRQHHVAGDKLFVNVLQRAVGRKNVTGFTVLDSFFYRPLPGHHIKQSAYVLCLCAVGVRCVALGIAVHQQDLLAKQLQCTSPTGACCRLSCAALLIGDRYDFCHFITLS